MTRPSPSMAVRDLVKTFSAGKGQHITALDGINLDVPGGSFVSIVGASGCGKSTLLSIAGGLDLATSGWVEIDGERGRRAGPGPGHGLPGLFALSVEVGAGQRGVRPRVRRLAEREAPGTRSRSCSA